MEKRVVVINEKFMASELLPHDEKFLHQRLLADPSDWNTRRRLAHALYDRDAFLEAAETIWQAHQIPNIDVELAFSARVLSKAQPRRAIRLLTAVLEMNRGKAIQNMAMANALLHHGLVLQAARFYGAALECDSSLVNPDLEHFVLWTDDEMRLWADFTDRRPKLGDLPWIVRDPKEALKLTSSISLHTTPVFVPKLPTVPGENLSNVLYRQEAEKNAKITPPPAVTIPIDRVDPKYRRFDERYGAATTNGSQEEASVAYPSSGRSPLIRPLESSPAQVVPQVEVAVQVPFANPVYQPAAQQNYQTVVAQPQYQPVIPQPPQYQPVIPQSPQSYQPVMPHPVPTMPQQQAAPPVIVSEIPTQNQNAHLSQAPVPAIVPTRRMIFPAAPSTAQPTGTPVAKIKLK